MDPWARRRSFALTTPTPSTRSTPFGFSNLPSPGCSTDCYVCSETFRVSHMTRKTESVFPEVPFVDPSHRQPPSSLIRLLIVDDEESMRKLMTVVLAGTGIESKTA